MSNFMTERITEDAGKAFAPSRYGLKSKADCIIEPYKTYALFFEITFHVLQKLGVYEDIGTPEECRKAVEMIKDAPTIEIPTWIPVSERLPEDFGYVLTSCGDGDVFFEWYDGIGSFPADVIAWMPLPKPYEVPDAE